MTLDEVLAAIQFWRPNSSWGTAPAAELPVSQLSTVDEARIIDAIRALYASTTARPVLIALATYGALKFGNRPQGEQYSAFANVLQDFVGINWHDVSLSKTINLNGVVVYLDPVLLIAHELYHLYSKSSNDPTAPVTSSEGGDAAENSLTDLFGPIETFANQVSSEIGRSGNSSAGYLVRYSPLDPRYDLLEIGTSYTDNNVIDQARIGISIGFLGSPLGGGGVRDIDNNIDTLYNSSSSARDLIIGLGGNDTIISNAGNDYIWAGDGNDTIDAGADNDYINGGAGEDTLVIGLPSNIGANISFRGISPGSSPQQTSIELVNGGDTDRFIDIEKIQLTDKSDRVALLGDVDDMDGGGPTVAMGLSAGPAAFGQDVVDASASTTGIYFDMGTGAVVGLTAWLPNGGDGGLASNDNPANEKLAA